MQDLLMFLVVLVVGILIGGNLTKCSGNSDLLDKQYEQCVQNTPRNKTCKFVSANFEIVDEEWIVMVAKLGICLGGKECGNTVVSGTDLFVGVKGIKLL